MKTSLADNEVCVATNGVQAEIGNRLSPLEQPIERLPSVGRESKRRSLGQVEIREVISRRDRNQFIRFPWRIYAGDQNWAPPLLIESKAFLDRRRHPFYLHAEATQYLAYRGQECVGRVLVSSDPHYNAEHGTNLGCFGMFESVDDQDVANALLNAAGGWLRRRGRTDMIGPIDYSTNYPCGLLIDGFDTPQRVMMNHNPAYYAALLENWGLNKAKDLYAWWFDDSFDMPTRWARRAARLAARGKVKIRPLSLRDFDEEVARCNAIYNQAWETCWGFVKMTHAEFQHLAQHLKQFAVPEWILVAEVDGRPAGLCVTIPDFNEATAPLNGRLTCFGLPIGLLKLIRNMRRIRSARLLVLGVLPEFRSRGVAELFMLRTIEIGRQRMGCARGELGWTLEDNWLINGPIEKVGGRHYKTYRIYQAQIAYTNDALGDFTGPMTSACS